MIAQSHYPELSKEERKLNEWSDKMEEKNKGWGFVRFVVNWDYSGYYGKVIDDLRALDVNRKFWNRKKFKGEGIEIECHEDVSRVMRLNRNVITNVMEFHRDKAFKDIPEYKGAATTYREGPFAYIRARNEARGQRVIDVLKKHNDRINVYSSLDDYIIAHDKELIFPKDTAIPVLNTI